MKKMEFKQDERFETSEFHIMGGTKNNIMLLFERKLVFQDTSKD